MSGNLEQHGWSFQYRYIAYCIVLYTNFQEAFTRFGLPMTMVAGLVKKNCSDPLDNGTYCWTEEEKASTIGAFFYTYCLQIPVIWAVVASKLGFVGAVRIYMATSGLLTFWMPWYAALSPYAVIAAQAMRGIVAIVIIPHTFYFIRTWTVPSESQVFLTVVGSSLILGVYSGQMLAGSISSALGWEYFYYICGTLWGILFILHCVFVQNDVQQSRWLSAREKALYPKVESTEGAQGTLSMVKIFRKVYLYSFCVFFFTYNYSFYMCAQCFPFYLNEILHFDIDQCSYIMLVVGITMAATNLTVSKIYPVVDKHLPWITSRQIFTFIPCILQSIGFIILPNCYSRPLAISVIVLLSMSMSTLYSGSVITINYELDPVNAAVISSVFNSCGQLSGFFAPWFRETITTTNLFDPDYYNVYRGRWAIFFYASAGLPVIGITAVFLAMKVKRGEWVLSPLLVKEDKVIENRMVLEEVESAPTPHADCVTSTVIENTDADKHSSI